MTTTKKVVKTVAKKVVVKKDVLPVTPTKKYQVVMKFNDESYDFETDDLVESIINLKPVFLKTRILFEAKHGDKVCERMLLLNRGKLLFRNRLTVMVFVHTLLFK